MTSISGSPPKRGVGGRLSLGALSFMGAMVATRVFGVLSIAVLGRILTPEDFGVVALAVFVVGGLEALLGRYFELALIRVPEPDRSHVGVAFTLSAIWGATAAAAAALLAEPIAALLDAPAVAPALRWLALAPLLDGLRNPGFALHEKALRFGPPALQEIAARFSVLAVSVSLALLWRDYWAMIVGMIAFSATRTAISHFAAPVAARPTFTGWRELAAFSGWMIGAGALGYLYRRIDRALVGAGLGVAEVGQYRMGDEISVMATSQVARPLLRVVYPGLAGRAADPEALRRGYSLAQGLILALLLPIGVIAALTAEDLLHLIVGEQWLAAAPVIQILAPLLALHSMTNAVEPLIYLRGETRTLFLRNLFIVGFTVPALWLGLAAGGFVGVIAARGVAILVQTSLTLAIAARVTGASWFDPLLQSWRTFAACIAAAAAIAAAAPTLLPEPDGILVAAIRLVVQAALGGATYVGVHLLLWWIAGAPDGPERAVKTLLRSYARFWVTR